MDGGEYNGITDGVLYQTWKGEARGLLSIATIGSEREREREREGGGAQGRALLFFYKFASLLIS